MVSFGGAIHPDPSETNREKTINIEYTVQIRKEGSDYIAHTMPLDVMSSGKSREEAKKALKEAVHLFIKTAKDMGTLEEILDECGYMFVENDCKSPAWVAIERQEMALVA